MGDGLAYEDFSFPIFLLEDENEMINFKEELMVLIDKYCQPEVAYEVYSDKDLEEEAKAEEEMMK